MLLANFYFPAPEPIWGAGLTFLPKLATIVVIFRILVYHCPLAQADTTL